MNTFKFVGKIKKLEDKKDKKFIETINFDSGWTMEKIKFRMVCGDSNQFIDAYGGKWNDDSKNTVYTYFRKEGADTKLAVEKAQVEWNKRFNPDILEKVPHFKRFTIDLASDKLREEAKNANDTAEVERLAALKYSYISNYDFALKLEEFLRTDKFGDENYVVVGNVEYSYSNKTDSGSYYRSFVPTSIYKAGPNDIPNCSGRLEFYYNKEDVLGEALENGDIPLNGYVQFYDRTSRDNFYAPIVLTLKPDNAKREGFLKLFGQFSKYESDILVLGTMVQYYSGSEKTEITEDDLTDDQKTLIAWGLKTKEEVIKEMGGSAYGDKVNYIYLVDIAKGFSGGPQDPELPEEKLFLKPDGVKKEAKNPQAKNVKIDLFSDDEDDDI